jgi:hypothetical protein
MLWLCVLCLLLRDRFSSAARISRLVFAGLTTMFYKFNDTDRQWHWTPDQEKTFWMPCSTIIVDKGPFIGKKPAYFNVEIIEYLNEHRTEPPKSSDIADLEWLKEGLLWTMCVRHLVCRTQIWPRIHRRNQRDQMQLN